MPSQEKAEHAETYREFGHFVNMSHSELEEWLKTEESKEVGQKKSEGSESTGHQSGRHILHLQGKKKADLTDDDYAQMARVVGYIKRHTAQRPEGKDAETLEHTNWTYSLKNWGHDPMKK